MRRGGEAERREWLRGIVAVTDARRRREPPREREGMPDHARLVIDGRVVSVGRIPSSIALPGAGHAEHAPAEAIVERIAPAGGSVEAIDELTCILDTGTKRSQPRWCSRLP